MALPFAPLHVAHEPSPFGLKPHASLMLAAIRHASMTFRPPLFLRPPLPGGSALRVEISRRRSLFRRLSYAIPAMHRLTRLFPTTPLMRSQFARTETFFTLSMPGRHVSMHATGAIDRRAAPAKCRLRHALSIRL